MTTLCKDCRYAKHPSLGIDCCHPANLHFSCVDGEMHSKQTADYCRDKYGHCGPNAKNFAPILVVA
jgi:hypothetical protein